MTSAGWDSDDDLLNDDNGAISFKLGDEEDEEIDEDALLGFSDNSDDGDSRMQSRFKQSHNSGTLGSLLSDPTSDRSRAPSQPTPHDDGGGGGDSPNDSSEVIMYNEEFDDEEDDNTTGGELDVLGPGDKVSGNAGEEMMGSSIGGADTASQIAAECLETDDHNDFVILSEAIGDEDTIESLEEEAAGNETLCAPGNDAAPEIELDTTQEETMSLGVDDSDDSDSSDAEETDTRSRGDRFKSERRDVKSLPTRASKSDVREIPDTLDVNSENVRATLDKYEQQKAAKNQGRRNKGRSRGGRGDRPGPRRGDRYGPGPGQQGRYHMGGGSNYPMGPGGNYPMPRQHGPPSHHHMQQQPMYHDSRQGYPRPLLGGFIDFSQNQILPQYIPQTPLYGPGPPVSLLGAQNHHHRYPPPMGGHPDMNRFREFERSSPPRPYHSGPPPTPAIPEIAPPPVPTQPQVPTQPPVPDGNATTKKIIINPHFKPPSQTAPPTSTQTTLPSGKPDFSTPPPNFPKISNPVPVSTPPPVAPPLNVPPSFPPPPRIPPPTVGRAAPGPTGPPPGHPTSPVKQIPVVGAAAVNVMVNERVGQRDYRGPSALSEVPAVPHSRDGPPARSRKRSIRDEGAVTDTSVPNKIPASVPQSISLTPHEQAQQMRQKKLRELIIQKKEERRKLLATKKKLASDPNSRTIPTVTDAIPEKVAMHPPANRNVALNQQRTNKMAAPKRAQNKPAQKPPGHVISLASDGATDNSGERRKMMRLAKFSDQSDQPPPASAPDPGATANTGPKPYPADRTIQSKNRLIAAMSLVNKATRGSWKQSAPQRGRGGLSTNQPPSNRPSLPVQPDATPLFNQNYSYPPPSSVTLAWDNLGAPPPLKVSNPIPPPINYPPPPPIHRPPPNPNPPRTNYQAPNYPPPTHQQQQPPPPKFNPRIPPPRPPWPNPSQQQQQQQQRFQQPQYRPASPRYQRPMGGPQGHQFPPQNNRPPPAQPPPAMPHTFPQPSAGRGATAPRPAASRAPPPLAMRNAPIKTRGHPRLARGGQAGVRPSGPSGDWRSRPEPKPNHPAFADPMAVEQPFETPKSKVVKVRNLPESSMASPEKFVTLLEMSGPVESIEINTFTKEAKVLFHEHMNAIQFRRKYDKSILEGNVISATLANN